jgi:hypothetical protein
MIIFQLCREPFIKYLRTPSRRKERHVASSSIQYQEYRYGTVPGTSLFVLNILILFYFKICVRPSFLLVFFSLDSDHRRPTTLASPTTKIKNIIITRTKKIIIILMIDYLL